MKVGRFFFGGGEVSESIIHGEMGWQIPNVWDVMGKMGWVEWDLGILG